MKRLYELDALRGLAALSVVFFHFTVIYNKHHSPLSSAPILYPLGYYGVHLFFMISGFVIFMTIEKTEKPKDFIISRLSRLFPTYWMVILINVLFIKAVPLKQLLFNLTMLQEWFHVKHIDQVFWTLTVELSFYIVMLFLFITRKLKYIEEIGLAWLALMLLNVRIFHLETSMLLQYGNLFLAGIVFYNLKFKGNKTYRHIILLLCWITQFFVAREFFPSPLVVGLYFIIFYLFCFNRLKFIMNPVTVLLGEVSYSLYLIHENLGFKVLKFFDSLHINYYLNFILAFLICFSLATLITFCFERPVIRFIRGFSLTPSKAFLRTQGQYILNRK